MIADDLETAIAKLRELIHEPGWFCPLLGPGFPPNAASLISVRRAGCGPRTVRSPSTNFWRAKKCATKSWRRRFAMEDKFATARPGRGHLALASLYGAGKTPGGHYQNIDNLHQCSGIAPEHVVELHGNNTYALMPRLCEALRVGLGQGKI